ncbi:GNAT family N-acetyltransferase [Cocleimonas sp. KMM 6892]|uniref:GNAT family N-acetyltransferase n=1 Tax=unclassified Cocleimonas TaxID=2639732 RepID=UPI002DB78CE4|nr:MULTISPECIES: GNAT family N-acetyltransferase [unclassified Cocleimonas]MEB8431715.1 GNAT family N-acetyltransferase [Cocleimonas sp. KMM 6892]MEC4715199.1 GNAT family N-acetyltransferase [Cocleimonas sp. KMM 6895]MEC4743987.1 GNAT family N-acetyltransferase [Cocleimonas sp. KMM 6896]
MHTIRQYIESDLDDVLATWENANKLAHPFLKEDFVAQVRKDIPALYLPNADTWVIEDDNEKKVVGFIALIGNEVGAIFLQPEHHGKKLGKMMMDIAHQLHGDLELEVFEKNTIGREFYKQYGFTQIDEMEHEASGEHVLRLKYTA